MMKIISDSSANISALEGVCFQSIPMTIRAGEREFMGDGTLDTAKMLDYLASYNGKSGTACPASTPGSRRFPARTRFSSSPSQARCPAPALQP